ncbi:MAG TPA: hypothetical protein VGD17_19410 [Chitinophagaceae bacterium]
MNDTAKSVMYFGFYLYLVGLALVFIPNVLLGVLRIEETREVWLRVAGVLTICIAYYYHRMGAGNNIHFAKLTIPTRVFVFLSFTVFAILDLVSPVIIGFGIVDLAGAMWTWSALRKQAVSFE